MRNKKTRSKNFSIDREIADQFDTITDQLSINQSKLIQRLITNYLKNNIRYDENSYIPYEISQKLKGE